MISGAGIPSTRLGRIERRQFVVQRRPVRMSDKMSVRSNKIVLNFEPKMIGDLLKNAVMPAVNRSFGRRFTYYVNAIAFLKQCGYSSLSSLPKTFQKSFASRMLKVLAARYPAFKKNLDQYFGRFSGKGAKAIRDSASAKLVYRTIYKQTQVQGASGFTCPGAATPQPTPATPAPVAPIARPAPKPVDKQLVRQAALIRGVSTAMGRKLRSPQVKSLLSKITKRKWRELKGLGVVAAIKSELINANMLKSGASDSQVRRAVKTTVKRWKAGSTTVDPQTGAPAQPRRSPRPVREPPPLPRPINKQLIIQSALMRGVSTAMGRKLNSAQVKSLLSKITKQKWQQLKGLGVVDAIKTELINVNVLKSGASDSQVQGVVKIAVRRWKTGSTAAVLWDEHRLLSGLFFSDPNSRILTCNRATI